MDEKTRDKLEDAAERLREIEHGDVADEIEEVVTEESQSEEERFIEWVQDEFGRAPDGANSLNNHRDVVVCGTTVEITGSVGTGGSIPALADLLDSGYVSSLRPPQKEYGKVRIGFYDRPWAE